MRFVTIPRRKRKERRIVTAISTKVMIPTAPFQSNAPNSTKRVILKN